MTGGCSRILYEGGESVACHPPSRAAVFAKGPSLGDLGSCRQSSPLISQGVRGGWLRRHSEPCRSRSARFLVSPRYTDTSGRFGRIATVGSQEHTGRDDAEGMALLATARLRAYRARTWTEAKAPHGRGLRARSKRTCPRVTVVLQKSVVQSRLTEASRSHRSGAPGAKNPGRGRGLAAGGTKCARHSWRVAWASRRERAADVSVGRGQRRPAVTTLRDGYVSLRKE